MTLDPHDLESAGGPPPLAPWCIDADHAAATLRRFYGTRFDAVMEPQPFVHEGVIVDAQSLEALHGSSTDPLARLFETLCPGGMLPPERLGVDVPFVGIILATFDPACTGPARLAARRFVSRLADVNLDEVPVHGVTEVVAHLTHALMAHLDGRLHEAKRALHCAGIVAEFLDAEPGLGHAAYVRAARLLHHHAPSQETP